MKHQALLEVVIWIRISMLTVFRASPEFVTAACEHAGGKLLSLVGVRAAPVRRLHFPSQQVSLQGYNRPYMCN